MARTLPGSPDKLLGITGIREVTMRKYGHQFLELLKKIRQEG
jgi:hypothetical protein